MNVNKLSIPELIIIFRPSIWNGVGMYLCPNCENEIIHEPYPNPNECIYCHQKLMWEQND